MMAMVSSRVVGYRLPSLLYLTLIKFMLNSNFHIYAEWWLGGRSQLGKELSPVGITHTTASNYVYQIEID